MTILSPEQIDALAQSGITGNGSYLIATARAYHDLRDAVLALCDGSPDNGIGVAAIHEADVRAAVARVERGGS